MLPLFLPLYFLISRIMYMNYMLTYDMFCLSIFFCQKLIYKYNRKLAAGTLNLLLLLLPSPRINHSVNKIFFLFIYIISGICLFLAFKCNENCRKEDIGRCLRAISTTFEVEESEVKLAEFEVMRELDFELNMTRDKIMTHFHRLYATLTSLEIASVVCAHCRVCVCSITSRCSFEFMTLYF
jgi:hypothetical protein